jgi:predicted dehydrogenase
MNALHHPAAPCSNPPSSKRGAVASDASLAASWSRRQFLRTAAMTALGAPFLLCSRQALGRRIIPPNGKLRHACIGVGGMGWNDLHNFLDHPRVEIVALCDVDSSHLEQAAKVVPTARLYGDWRELLEEGAIDSVNLAVPDHTHFSIAYSAIQRGKHVYCQKPMCHDVVEVRTLTEAAAKAGVVTQLGTQFAATVHERTAVLWLKQRRIGKVKHAYLCSNRPGAVETYRLKGPRPAHGQPPPKNLNWDHWIGTAPFRPYVPDIYHPTKWRAWQDFGTGWSGDIGCHIFDPIWKGLNMEPCLTVSAEVQQSWKDSPARRADTWPQADHITWTFPANDRIDGDRLVLEWFDGSFYPPREIRELYSKDLTEYPSESSMLIGTEGALLIPLGMPPQLLPEAKFPNVKRPKLREENHYHLFADACLGGAPTESLFARTGPMTESILLGTVAIRVPGQKLEWDTEAMKITNTPEANRFLRRTYRKGWHLAEF